MLPVDQPSVRGPNRPTITDAKSCEQWLTTLPLTHVPVAHSELLLQMELLNHTSSLSGIERFRIMEQLREPVAYVQESLNKKYLGKSIPLDPTELATWKKVLALWQSFTLGYQICLQNFEDNDQSLNNAAATILHRILRLTGLHMLEYQRVYQNVPEMLWQQLHKTYLMAEMKQLAKQQIKDPLNRLIESTRPESAFLQAVLVDLADPYHLQAKQLGQIDRWLDKWTARVSLALEAIKPIAPELKLPTLVIDLARPTGIQLGNAFESSSSIRHLDINMLAATLIKRIKQLRKGEPANELDLGEDCAQPLCESTLTYLFRQWCEPMQYRAYERRPGRVKVQVSFTLAAIHFFCNGSKPFRQPGERAHTDLSWREVQDLQLFGRVSQQTIKTQTTQAGYSAENWQVQDESALGFRLSADGLHAARLNLGQLIAIRHPDAKHFAAGVVRWLRFDTHNDLNIGVSTFPGIPMAVGIRAPVLIPNLHNKFQQAFLLPEIPALKAPASLILPQGWYSENKKIELLIENPLMVRLTSLMARGYDFDRVAFDLQ